MDLHAPPVPPPLPSVDPPPPASPPGLRLGVALLVCAINLAITFLVAIPLGVYYGVMQLQPDALLITFAGQVVGWPLAMWIGLILVRRRWGECYAIGPFPFRLLPGVVLASLGLAIVLGYTASLIPMPDFFRRAMMGLRNGNALLFITCVTVIAPLAEELFFRGWMLRGFLRSYSPAKSIWLTAVIFALFHLNPWQAVLALPLGLLFGWLVLRTGSLAPGIIGHFVVNFSTNYVILPLALLLGHSVEEIRAATRLPADVVALGGVMTLVGLLALAWGIRSAAVPGPGVEPGTDS